MQWRGSREEYRFLGQERRERREIAVGHRLGERGLGVGDLLLEIGGGRLRHGGRAGTQRRQGKQNRQSGHGQTITRRIAAWTLTTTSSSAPAPRAACSPIACPPIPRSACCCSRRAGATTITGSISRSVTSTASAIRA